MSDNTSPAAPADSGSAIAALNDMINQYTPDGTIDFESDESDALFEAVARYANNNAPLPETPEEIEKLIQSMPLTATHMPAPGEESDAFKALKSIVDSVPVEKRMHQYKESGNRSYKLALRMNEPRPNETREDRARRLVTRKAKLEEAIAFYTQSLEVGPKEKTAEAELKATLYCNRAQAHLGLENYGYVVRDCGKALGLNAHLPKAYYRASLALFKLHKYPQAFVMCRQGLAMLKSQAVAAAKNGAAAANDGEVATTEKSPEDTTTAAAAPAAAAAAAAGTDAKPAAAAAAHGGMSAEQKQLLALAKEIVPVWKRADDTERARLAKKKADAEAKALVQAKLDAVIKKRGVTIGEAQFKESVGQYDAKPYVDDKNSLHWPVVFLYPDVSQSDYFADVDESAPISALLKQLFPPAAAAPGWDTKGEYTLSNIEVYVMIGTAQSFMEDAQRVDEDGAGVKITLSPASSVGHALSALSKKGYVIPGIPTFCIRPLNSNKK